MIPQDDVVDMDRTRCARLRHRFSWCCCLSIFAFVLCIVAMFFVTYAAICSASDDDYPMPRRYANRTSIISLIDIAS